jgi:putative membrane protein
MISQSVFAAGAGAAEAGADALAVGAGVLAVGAGALAVGAGALAVADGQGVAVADVAGAGIVVEEPAVGAAVGVTVAAGAGPVEAPPATAGVAPAAAGAAWAQGFAGAAALTEASSMVLMCGVMTAAIPTPSTTARSPIISAGRARGGRFSWVR